MKKFILSVLVLTAVCINSLIANTASSSNLHVHQLIYGFDDNIKIKFILGDQTYELQSYNLNYFIPDSKTDATSLPFVGLYNQSNTITLSLRTSKVDQGLLTWLMNVNQESKNGQLVIYDPDSGKVLKTISFTDLKTSSYNENSNANFNTMQITNFSLRYQSVHIKIGS